MKYFRLATNCYLIEGDKDAAVYDVSHARIFLLDETSYRILRRCEDGAALDESDPTNEDEIELLNRLCDERLGFFEHAPAFVDKFLPHAPVEWRGFCLQPPRYRRADWSITNRCELACSFCPRDGAVSWQACQTCVRRDLAEEDRRLFERPQRIVQQIADLGVAVLHIRGGNPLLDWERLQAIIETAGSYPHLSVIITTPGTGQSVDRILTLYKIPNLRLNVVMLGISAASVGDVCGKGQTFNRQVQLVDALSNGGLPFFVTFLLSRSTRHDRDEMIRFAQTRWQATPSFAEIYRQEEMPEQFRFTHLRANAKPLVPWRSVEEFYFRIRSNTCLYGAFEISADGGIKPCAGLDQTCGQVVGGKLRSALRDEQLYSLWNLGKSDIEPCDRCALRYACADCTAAELAGTAKPTLKQAYCPFEPGGDARASESRWDHDGFVQVVKLEGKKVSCQLP